MKKTPLVCVILLVAGLGFADPLEMTHREIHIDSQNPSRTDAYINRSGDNMQPTDPIVGTAALNDWREKTTSTLVVDKNGRGDYTTIQGAIDAINDSAPTNPYVVYIMPGVYEEQVILSKSYVSLIGVQPNGGKIIEAQNSGAIITYASSGVGNDLMTLWIKSGGATDLKGITIANLTIINTQILGVGGMQGALDIGRGDTYPRTHEVLVKNCSLYGEQDTVYVCAGKPIFQNCYIEGENDICSIASDSIFQNVYFYVHSDHGVRCAIWIGGDGTAITAKFYNCIFDKKVAQTSGGGVGRFGDNPTTTMYFYNCKIMPNIAFYCWNWRDQPDCSIYLYNTNGARWGANAPSGSAPIFIAQQGLEISSALLPAKLGITYTGWGSAGALLELSHAKSIAGTNNDEAGRINFSAPNATPSTTKTASIVSLITDVTAGSEDGVIDFYTMTDGTESKKFRMTSDGKLEFKNAETIDNNTDGLLAVTGSLGASGGLNVGTATGAAAGEINTSGNISASGQRITAKLFDVEHYTGGLPTASSMYRGCLAFVEGGMGSEDKLYVCVKNADGSYGWDEIGQGTSESRIRFE